MTYYTLYGQHCTNPHTKQVLEASYTKASIEEAIIGFEQQGYERFDVEVTNSYGETVTL